jgi:hypothetical protein
MAVACRTEQKNMLSHVPIHNYLLLYYNKQPSCVYLESLLVHVCSSLIILLHPTVALHFIVDGNEDKYLEVLVGNLWKETAWNT